MSLSTIRRLHFPALLFALGVSGMWVLARLATRRGRKRDRRREGLYLLLVFYLAAVVEIIALRMLETSASSAPQLVPLRTTFAQFQAGAGPFVYHTVGNLVWFMPLGILLPRLWPRFHLGSVAACGFGLSLLVEACQWLLGTGMPDVDDLLLNTLGAALGYVAFCLCRRRAQR